MPLTGFLHQPMSSPHFGKHNNWQDVGRIHPFEILTNNCIYEK